MTEIIIPKWKELVLYDNLEYHFSKYLLELSKKYNTSILSLIQKIPINWIARSENFFEGISDYCAYDPKTAEVVYETSEDVKVIIF